MQRQPSQKIRIAYTSSYDVITPLKGRVYQKGTWSFLGIQGLWAASRPVQCRLHISMEYEKAGTEFSRRPQAGGQK